jgi:glutamate synthase (NADPH/NADH) small chain
MSGYAHEWKAAKIEGARALWHAQPLSYVGAGGKVTGLRCAKLGADRKPVAGETLEVPADLVLLAIGQGRLGELVAGLDGVQLQDGRLVVDADGATGNPRVFAGGDCANGGMEVVNAVAEGKRAALAIDRALQASRPSGPDQASRPSGPDQGAQQGGM